MNLTEARSEFIEAWGQFGQDWGINRTMARIHGLLLASAEPLHTDRVMEELSISRGNANTNLRGLLEWGVIRKVHRPGERREYFEAEKDVWQMFEIIMRERRRREVQPIVETIERCLTMVEKEKAELRGQDRKDAEAYKKRFTDILDFCEAMNTLFNLMSKAGRGGLKPIVSTLGKLTA